MKKTLILSLIIMLNACANASFPDLEGKSNTLVADAENANYENFEKIEKQPTTPVVIENKITEKKQVAKVETKKVKEPVKKVAVAKKAIEPKVVEPQKEDIKKPTIEVLKDTFYFRDGSCVLESTNVRIKNIANFVKENNAKVKIIGHSSSRTQNTDPISHKMANFNASFNRATNVAKALEKAGVKKENIAIEALSDSKPAYLEVMPEGERLNRRAEVYLIY